MKTIPLEEALKLAPVGPRTARFPSGITASGEVFRYFPHIEVPSVFTNPAELIVNQGGWGEMFAFDAHAALLAHFYNHGPELVEALKPLAAIAKDWESNGLDGTRPDWGDTKEKILNLDLVCGRGGKTLLRMKDVFRAAEALAKASTVQMP